MFRESRRVVLKDDPTIAEIGEDWMEFRLTYDGLLMSTQRDPTSGQKDARAAHKHEIRRQFHPQLKRLWSVNRFLREYKVDPYDFDWGKRHHPIAGTVMGRHQDERPLVEVVAAQFPMFGYSFVPLVCEDLWLNCSIDVLFLRRDAPGSVFQSGDIDNRIKTLLDALRLPKKTDELAHYTTPSDDETPFFCLLEDDRLITRLAVETDWLLDPVTDCASDTHRVRLVIKVVIQPAVVTMVNMNFT